MRKLFLLLAAMVTASATWAQDVKIEFFTPRIVHIVKGKPTKTLVVTAKPEQVAVTQKGNVTSSSELTVKQDPKTGALSSMPRLFSR